METGRLDRVSSSQIEAGRVAWVGRIESGGIR